MVADCIPGFQPRSLCKMPEVRGLFCNNESLPSLPPAYPAFSFASAPIPPPPFPAGWGETISFFAGGSAPGAPGIRPFTALTAPAAVVPRRGACPLGRLPTLPVACFSAPSPDPLPLRGRGRFLVFLCKGLRPLHPGVWTGRGTGSASIGGTPRAACILVAGSPATATPGGVGQTKRGP